MAYAPRPNDSRLKVAFYTPTASGGHARFTQCTMEGIHLASPGIELVLCTSHDLAPGFRQTSYRISAVLPPLRPRSAFDSRLAWAVSRLRHYTDRDRRFLEWVQEEKPDIVHLQEWFPFGAAKLVRALHRQGVRVILTVHNLFRHEDFFPGHSWLQGLFEHRGWASCDRLIVMSPELAGQLSELARVPGKRIRCVPHFVWPEGSSVAPGGEEAKRLRRTALLFGALRRNKGAEILIAACAREPEFHAIIAGHSPDRDYCSGLETLVRQMGAKVVIRNRFYGEAELPALFAEASVAVFPYTSFGSQSGALFTAVSHETPVIGTRVGALGATIEREGIGLGVPPQNIVAMAEAIAAIHRPDAYGRMMTQIRALKHRQGITAIGESLAGIYRELLEESVLPD